MFLILEFTACFMMVCGLAALVLAACGTGYALTVIAKRSAEAIRAAYRARVHSQEAARLSSSDVGALPVPVVLADCAL